MGHQDYLGVMGMFCILIMVEVSRYILLLKLVNCTFNFFKNVFIDLAVPGLNCGFQDL